MFMLQTLVMPHLDFTAPEDMYVRLHTTEVSASLKDQKLVFRQHGRASFDTYFNSVSVGVWKKNCKIDDIGITLRGEGEFILRYGLHRIGHAHVWLDEQRVTLTERDQYFSFDRWQDLDGGMLYIYLESVFGGSLYGGGWVTSTPSVRDVKLGIVITHFNRKNYVIPAIKRIKKQLLDDSAFSGKIELVVVDNSRNLTSEETCWVTLIPNQNLGGSGGFMRGLLHLKDNHSFTHCLFMDDDASCEIESIRRAYRLLSYSFDDALSIAGGLLRELEPNKLLEKGAMFNGFVRQFKSGLNMSDVSDLLRADFIDFIPQYGAWFFFAFPIGHVKSYAFPYFVRGDDIAFGLSNGFTIATMNGIGVWGDDFALKAGPMPNYLDTRNHLLNGIVFNDLDYASIKKIADHFVIKQLYSYNYASARACRYAVQHIMKGPEFFNQHIGMSELRNEISSFSASEHVVPVDRKQFVISPPERAGWFREFVRRYSLNGFLVPGLFFNKETYLFQHKGFMADLRNIFLRSKVLYEYEPFHVGYVAVHDKKRFFKEYWTYLSVMRDFKKKFSGTKQKWSEGFPRMTSEQFWRDVYKDE
ncbi:glycosyltransferase family 2 protein [Acidithiobacillus thiooxidans]|uniref:Galactofuranosyltransferase GlfT2 n=2 Tax=Acidithiobacillus thiooxidans TaxID=930 RepID=A0A543Q3B6_ACITH|nr:glycosyltransferase [Acidithiobacillus thiooxidans]TQN50811.1 Galactofuranosyltransferase GlfT2 [Acidithiobacillus thiooxidans ATCC 19377]